MGRRELVFLAVVCFETAYYIALAVLELAVWTKMALNSQEIFLPLLPPGAEIKGVHHMSSTLLTVFKIVLLSFSAPLLMQTAVLHTTYLFALIFFVHQLKKKPI